MTDPLSHHRRRALADPEDPENFDAKIRALWRAGEPYTVTRMIVRDYAAPAGLRAVFFRSRSIYPDGSGLRSKAHDQIDMEMVRLLNDLDPRAVFERKETTFREEPGGFTTLYVEATYWEVPIPDAFYFAALPFEAKPPKITNKPGPSSAEE